MKKYFIGILIGLLLGASGAALAVTSKSYNFPDVPFDSSAFYRDALQEMFDRGVISGYKNGNFGPDDPVTRGQMVQILSRYNSSLTTYHGFARQDSIENVGFLMDVVCAKVQIDGNDSGDLLAKYTGLCKSRRESAGN